MLLYGRGGSGALLIIATGLLVLNTPWGTQLVWLIVTAVTAIFVADHQRDAAELAALESAYDTGEHTEP